MAFVAITPLHQMLVYHRQALLSGLGLLAFTLLLRLPFWFEAVLDWDESTFILMGQSMLDGRLPYTDLWDLKPPLAFASFALFIALLGKTIVSIRLAGTLCVAATAWLSYDLTRRVWGHGSGVLAGGFCVLMISLLPGGQSTMTETVAVVPLIVALYWLIRFPHLTSVGTFGVGCVLAIAALVRLNLLYVSLAVGGWLLYLALRQRLAVSQIGGRAIAFGAGHGLILGLTWLPYAIQGIPDVWWQSVIVAPLTYVGARASMVAALGLQLRGLAVVHASPTGLLGLWVWGGAIASSGYLIKIWPRLSAQQRHSFSTVLVLTGATTLSILRSGATHGHYLIQLAPLVSLLAAWGWGWVLSQRPLRPVGLAAIAVAVTLTLSNLTAGPYGFLVGRALAGKPLATSPAHGVAAYLRQHQAPQDTAYLLVDHIAYWFLNSQPLTPCTTHPSTLTKPDLLPYCAGDAAATPSSEMARVLALAPAFIVTSRPTPWYFRGYETVAQQLQATLEADYIAVSTLGDRVIYQHSGVRSQESEFRS